jgi:hypothetical protein
MTVYGSVSEVGMAANRHGLSAEVPVETGASYVDGFLRLAGPGAAETDTSITGG